MYKSIDKNEIERDCEDFRGSYHIPSYCLFSRFCDGPMEQEMFVDNYCGNGRERCLGICDENKVPGLKGMHVDNPTRMRKVIFFRETKEERVFELPEVGFNGELEKILGRFPELKDMEMNVRTKENRLVVIGPDREGDTKNLGYDYDED